jgi:hypothetical protein
LRRIPPPIDPAEDTPPASLDELLGLDDEESDGAREAAEREAEAELERRLDEENMTDAFSKALEKMRLSADFLDVEFDPGLGTQRIQEDILARLEEFIDLAKKQQGGGTSKSSPGQQSPEPPQNPGQKPPEPQSGNSQQRPEGQDGQQAQDLPAGREGDINTVLEETRTEWGTLPARERDELMQGRNDRYSTLYDRLTREYYRRLAEEGN